ncbi:MAG: hypothetical protein J1F40_04925 [Prevotellaceae bacterium]|nr:hypothetical protein [Prevotellaceae bacterium]
MKSISIVNDTIVVKFQSVTDSVSSTLQRAVESISANGCKETSNNDACIAIVICITMVLVVIFIGCVFIWWYRTKKENERKIIEKESWISLKKEYQKTNLEYIRKMENKSNEEDLYIKYIDKYIQQIDDHLKQ